MAENPQSFDNERLELIKLDKIVIANRAPNSSDKGMMWIHQTSNNDTTIDFYLRHRFSGTWRKASFT